MEWVDGNIGSKVTMKYPAVFLLGEHAKGETLSIAFAGEGQHQDAGVQDGPRRAEHVSSIDRLEVGRPRRRPHVLPRPGPGPRGRPRTRASTVRCDALLVDTISRSDTYPYVDIREDDVTMGHEATVSKVSRGPAVLPDVPRHDRGGGDGDDRARLRRAHRRELPMEYALELNRLIELQMEGAVG